jgi:cysteine desulfurase
MFGMKNKRVYLDWAAATPLSEQAFLAMEPFLRTEFGNPSAIHKEGVLSRQAVENARAEVAGSVQVRPEFVTFTGGGTEGNNLVIFGVVEALHRQGRDYSSMELITTCIEHPSLGKVMERLEELGVKVKYVRVDGIGRVEPSHLREILSEETVLVSCAYANSEIGTVQSLHGIRKAIREAEVKNRSSIYFHVDAAQAPLWLPCQFDSVGADFLVLDVAKCCGPKGIGVLVRSRRAEILPIMFGGGQEQGLRPGTENVSGIVGAGVAFREAQSMWRERAEQVSAVRDGGIKLLLETIKGAVLNGGEGEFRLANNINISIPGLDTEYAVVVLDSKGFAVSSKSACAGAGGGESVVVREISADPARASSTLRLSLGPDTKVEDIRELANVLATHINQMQKLTR